MGYLITAIAVVVVAFPAGFAAATYGIRNSAIVIRVNSEGRPVMVGLFSDRQAVKVAAASPDSYVFSLRKG